MDEISIRWHKSIKEINKSEWDKVMKNNNNPFYKWGWLKALEDSNSINPDKGWQSYFITAWKENNLVAIAPLYLKGHNYGEFIFDNIFLKLAQKLNINYYPKLVGMSPFSPIEGYRFFFLDGEDNRLLTKIIMKSIDNYATKNKISSCNFLYVDSSWLDIAIESKLSAWINPKPNYEIKDELNFSDFLLNFNANQRRNIKRERASIKNQGIEVSVKKGNDINKNLMKEMHNFYEYHCSKWGIWGSKYLSESFFEELANEEHRNEIILFLACQKNSKKIISMSLCVTNGEILWGRYWGSNQDIKNLHFEMCYYSPIEWAINNKLKSFDPGTIGSHKHRRGFSLKQNISLHKWYNSRMNDLLKEWLPKLNEITIKDIKSINNEMPLKSSNKMNKKNK